MRPESEYLKDILQAISDVERYAALGRERFDRDELVQTFMLHRILIIGEAASALSSGCRSRAPEIPWANIIGMRNHLIHGYFKADLVELWDTVHLGLPPLKAGIQRLLGLLDTSSKKEP